MFRKITVAFDESPEAGRALLAAVELAKSLHASLTVISVIEPAPIYFSFSTLAAPYIRWTDEIRTKYVTLLAKAREFAKTLDSPSKRNSQMEMKSRAFLKPQDIISLISLLFGMPNTIGSLATLRKKLQSTSLVRYWESGSY
jgi:nucleotide-binding universal stress UspA family protein